jgi:hypothetical protein
MKSSQEIISYSYLRSTEGEEILMQKLSKSSAIISVRCIPASHTPANTSLSIKPVNHKPIFFSNLRRLFKSSSKHAPPASVNHL